VSDLDLARALLDAAQADDDVALLEAEGAIIERLDISPDETEQGLTRGAVLRIEAFVSEALGQPWTYEDSGLLGVEGTSR
jgi:hypothetical protein